MRLQVQDLAVEVGLLLVKIRHGVMVVLVEQRCQHLLEVTERLVSHQVEKVVLAVAVAQFVVVAAVAVTLAVLVVMAVLVALAVAVADRIMVD